MRLHEYTSIWWGEARDAGSTSYNTQDRPLPLKKEKKKELTG
jgi:hypothetical protein